MDNLILREENFSYGILDKLPMPEVGECLLLYQIGAGVENSMIINRGVRYPSAKIRHGKYNRIVTLSLKEQYMIQKQRLIMNNQSFYFDVIIKVSIQLLDVKKFYFEEKVDENKIGQIVQDVIKANNGKWDIRQVYEVQAFLENEIEKRMRFYESLRIRILEFDVIPDEAATIMLQSNRDKEVEIHTYKNTTDEQIAKNEQNQKMFESEHKLKEMKMQEMASFMTVFGSLGPIADEYLKGNIDGTSFYEYYMKAKSDNLSILNSAVENDLLTQKEAFEKLSEILSDKKLEQIERTQQLTSEDIYKVENKRLDEEENEGGKNVLTDGDYI